MTTKRENTYSIGETEKLTGASQKPIRYWESQGYFQSYRNVYGLVAYRRFKQIHVDIIREIKGYLDQGFTLALAAELAIGENLNSD